MTSVLFFFSCRKFASKSTARLTLTTDACATSADDVIDRLEHVEATVRVKHPVRGDVQIVLVSPAGTKSTLLAPRRLDKTKTGVNFTFMSVHFWDERPAGAWQLLVSDKPAIGDVNAGEVFYWSLTLYGTMTSSALDDVTVSRRQREPSRSRAMGRRELDAVIVREQRRSEQVRISGKAVSSVEKKKSDATSTNEEGKRENNKSDEEETKEGRDRQNYERGSREQLEIPSANDLFNVTEKVGAEPGGWSQQNVERQQFHDRTDADEHEDVGRDRQEVAVQSAKTTPKEGWKPDRDLLADISEGGVGLSDDEKRGVAISDKSQKLKDEDAAPRDGSRRFEEILIDSNEKSSATIPAEKLDSTSKDEELGVDAGGENTEKVDTNGPNRTQKASSLDDQRDEDEDNELTNETYKKLRDLLRKLESDKR